MPSPSAATHGLYSDLIALGHEVARRLIEPGATRDRLTAGMFIGAADQPVGLLERALAVTVMAEPIERKLADAVRNGALAAWTTPAKAQAASPRAACRRA